MISCIFYSVEHGLGFMLVNCSMLCLWCDLIMPETFLKESSHSLYIALSLMTILTLCNLALALGWQVVLVSGTAVL